MKSKRTFGRKILRLIKYLIIIAVSLIGLLILAANIIPPPSERDIPAGVPRTQSFYIPMRDGVQIAVDVWLPKDLTAGEQVPAIIESTRYWRGQEYGVLGKIAPFLGSAPEPVNRFGRHGYAIVMVDARGSGASTGVREIEWSPDEVADMTEIVDWIITQAWSNGRVGGFGVSYSGNTAELLSSINHPAVKAVAPLYNDFDPHFQLVSPGGVYNSGIIGTWGAFTSALDRSNFGDVSVAMGGASPSAAQFINRFVVNGVKPVQGQKNVLESAVSDHAQNIDVAESAGNAEFRDDLFGDTATLGSVSPYSFQAEQEMAQVPSLFVAAWMDAGTVDGALSRYMTFDTPQQLVIAPVSHGGGGITDPYHSDADPHPYDDDRQTIELRQFFEDHLKGDGDLTRQISYYTMGKGWQMTTEWPPAGIATKQLWFGAEGELLEQQSTDEDGADSYTVDFTASTGASGTRWHTQLGSNVVYQDRAAEDEKLLTFDSKALTSPLEITGNPVVTLYVASSTSESAFHVYLESVAPDGTVHYITEGMLLGSHRKETSDSPYVQIEPIHSHFREDAQPLVPGEITELRIKLFATSVQIPADHQIRLALAGADDGIFAHYPTDGAVPVWQIQRNSIYGSMIELPVQK